ncbi:hypothetical protein MPTK1_2g09830 [Marchantia polymorpha subsp. ruderalis]|uniref:Uncharacterized protein n=2 Tax=Marchantia polymorpha TaxID=3197 RepID=A0A176WCF3_MARPO|nr:hypothetical protein AXG93_1474s1080 [Marchantia polymorpha subsp. ruderalis]PTQ30108.1 hypothetical protein MARPO_0129s0009 [Marchantia polymorpha]BBN01724.1 hypothetical protein Mp_2g09830 [Marchantia polymorpha subsp. ruderalis]|eukprot:PTQ30108.1 hypothetical protein MARPO_0129s0009 [Marchantia polymorpha]
MDGWFASASWLQSFEEPECSDAMPRSTENDGTSSGPGESVFIRQRGTNEGAGVRVQDGGNQNLGTQLKVRVVLCCSRGSLTEGGTQGGRVRWNELELVLFRRWSFTLAIDRIERWRRRRIRRRVAKPEEASSEMSEHIRAKNAVNFHRHSASGGEWWPKWEGSEISTREPAAGREPGLQFPAADAGVIHELSIGELRSAEHPERAPGRGFRGGARPDAVYTDSQRRERVETKAGRGTGSSRSYHRMAQKVAEHGGAARAGRTGPDRKGPERAARERSVPLRLRTAQQGRILVMCQGHAAS